MGQDPVDGGAEPGIERARGELRGIVVDAFGDAVPAAEVWIRGEGGVLQATKTDGLSEFAFDDVPTGPVTLHARRAGYTQMQLQVRVRCGQPGEQHCLTLYDAVELRGVVRDSAGNPVDRAVVLVRSRLLPAETVTVARSDAAGRYVVRHAPVGPVDVVAWAAGHEVVAREMTLIADATEDHGLVTGRPLSALVRLRGAPAQLVDGVPLQLAVNCEGLRPPLPGRLFATRFDRQGNAVIDGLPSNVQLGDVSVADDRIQLRSRRAGMVRDAVFEAVFDHVPSPPRVLRARFDPDGPGEALLGTGLWLEYADGRTLLVPVDDNGRLIGGQLPPVGESVRVRSPIAQVCVLKMARNWVGGMPIDVRSGKRARVWLVASTPLRGSLVDAKGGPVVGARVELAQPVFGGVAFSARATATDRAGQFEFRDLPGIDLSEYDLQLRVQARAGQAVVPCEADLSAGPVALEPIALSEPPRLQGVARDAGGMPLVGALVAIGNASGNVAQTLTDRQGRYRVSAPGLLPGPFDVRVATVLGAWQDKPGQWQPKPGEVHNRDL